MSTCVLISGQARTFAQCVANQAWMVYRHLDDPTFFVSVADDEQARDMYLLEAYYPGKVHIEIVKQPDDFPDAPPFRLCAHAPYLPTPNDPKVVKAIMRQLWHYKRVWEFMCKVIDGPHPTPDTKAVIRVRPDLFFHGKPESATTKSGLEPEWFVGPWKSTCGGVNDRFSIMGTRAAQAYFNAIDVLPNLIDAGCPVHPETIQRTALEWAGCSVFNTLLTEFTCVRLPGHGEHVRLQEYPGEMVSYLTAISR